VGAETSEQIGHSCDGASLAYKLRWGLTYAAAYLGGHIRGTALTNAH
jgi:hypothetical protein